MRPSEFRVAAGRDIDLPSAVPLRKLGVPVNNWYVGVVGVLNFREGALVESGLGGRLDIRPSARGGWGKELMLTVFRMVLPAELTPDTDRAPAGVGIAGGRRLAEGARRPLLGVVGVDLLKEDARPLVLFLVFATGKAGRAIDGGLMEGLAGLGSAVDMLSEVVCVLVLLVSKPRQSATDAECTTTQVPAQPSPWTWQFYTRESAGGVPVLLMPG